MLDRQISRFPVQLARQIDKSVIPQCKHSQYALLADPLLDEYGAFAKKLSLMGPPVQIF